MKSMKKGFTLIELLIVVAIIGILAGVGIPMYQGYIADSKDAAAKSNHASVKKYIASEITKCSINSGGKYGTGDTCTTSLSTMNGKWITYFNANGFNNPEGGDALANTTGPALGQTGISYTTYNGKQAIRIKTRLPSGAYLPASDYEYVTKE